jgi:vacuolar protein-sorting-associated protein 4
MKLKACSSNNPNARFMSWQEMPDNGLLPPKVRAEDFYGALAKAKSSVRTNELQRYQEWTEEFGMEGA